MDPNLDHCEPPSTVWWRQSSAARQDKTPIQTVKKLEAGLTEQAETKTRRFWTVPHWLSIQASTTYFGDSSELLGNMKDWRTILVCASTNQNARRNFQTYISYVITVIRLHKLVCTAIVEASKQYDFYQSYGSSFTERKISSYFRNKRQKLPKYLLFTTLKLQL